MKKQNFLEILKRAEIAYEINEVKKNNNCILEGIVLFTDDKKSGKLHPTIYPDFYERCEDEVEMLDKLFVMKKEYEKATTLENITDKFEDKKWVKERLRVAVRNIKWNKEDTETYTVECEKPFNDLEEYYYLKFTDEDNKILGLNNGEATIKITENWIETFEYNKEWIRKNARLNTKKEISIKTMFETLTECLPFKDEETTRMLIGTEDCGMYVISNENKYRGASCGILYQDRIKEFCTEMEIDKYIIIPSSINEVLLVKVTEMKTKEEIDTMVKEVNSTEVNVGDLLSDHAYLII